MGRIKDWADRNQGYLTLAGLLIAIPSLAGLITKTVQAVTGVDTIWLLCTFGLVTGTALWATQWLPVAEPPQKRRKRSASSPSLPSKIDFDQLLKPKVDRRARISELIRAGEDTRKPVTLPGVDSLAAALLNVQGPRVDRWHQDVSSYLATDVPEYVGLYTAAPRPPKSDADLFLSDRLSELREILRKL